MAKTRAERKARNRQRAGDRARHGATAAAAVTAAVDAAFAALEADAATDACLTVCDGCGLEQVSPKPRREWMDEFDPLAYGCVLCGAVSGRYSGPIPPVPSSVMNGSPTERDLAKEAELRALAADERDPARRERLLDSAAEYAGKSLNGAASDREKP